MDAQLDTILARGAAIRAALPRVAIVAKPFHLDSATLSSVGPTKQGKGLPGRDTRTCRLS
jgi:hypothetical protein